MTLFDSDGSIQELLQLFIASDNLTTKEIDWIRRLSRTRLASAGSELHYEVFSEVVDKVLSWRTSRRERSLEPLFERSEHSALGVEDKDPSERSHTYDPDLIPESLRKRYSTSQGFVIPSRKIVRISASGNLVFAPRDLSKPLAVFHSNIDYSGLSREELSNVDPSLYEGLRKSNLLSKAIPVKYKKRHSSYRGHTTPLDYFKNNPDLKNLTRTQLKRADRGLYSALSRHNELEVAIPEKPSYRGFNSPLEFYHHSPKLHGLTREELAELDSGLYSALYTHNQMQLAIPLMYRGHPTPLDYVLSDSELKKMTRGQISLKDSGLYHALKRSGQLNEIPTRLWRGYASAWDYFTNNFSRFELSSFQRDRSLNEALRRAGKLKEARKMIRNKS